MLIEQQTRAERHHHRHDRHEQRRHSHHHPERQRVQEIILRISGCQYGQEHQHGSERRQSRHGLGYRENNEQLVIAHNWSPGVVVVSAWSGEGGGKDHRGDEHGDEHA